MLGIDYEQMKDLEDDAKREDVIEVPLSPDELIALLDLLTPIVESIGEGVEMDAARELQIALSDYSGK